MPMAPRTAHSTARAKGVLSATAVIAWNKGNTRHGAVYDDSRSLHDRGSLYNDAPFDHGPFDYDPAFEDRWSLDDRFTLEPAPGAPPSEIMWYRSATVAIFVGAVTTNSVVGRLRGG